MQNVRFFVSLVRMLCESSSALGLDHLTESDRLIYMLLWEMADQRDMTVDAAFEQALERAQALGLKFSKPQFFKTLKILTAAGLIEHIGSARSGRYRLHEQPS